MSEGNNKLIKAKKEGLESIVNTLFATKTPKGFIKTRPGPGGLVIKYVEVGYVVSILNNAFGPFWEWKIADKEIREDQVWVQGELTIKSLEGLTITKTGFGGASIKKSRETGKPISIANDIKASSSDALKKAASLFGVASDIFYKEMDILEGSPDEVDEEADGNSFIKQQLMSKYFAIASEKGYSAEEAKDLIKTGYGVEHMEDLNKIQLELGVKAMEKRPEKITVETPDTMIIKESEEVDISDIPF
ncbi:hypothetical protein HY357_02810 [Candidatus Roizmanbacteria bacterium]|nr:hypothetical protein [Candidatus Roizmanbacteria bacterium]